MTLSLLKSMPGHLIRRAQQISTAIFAEEVATSELTSVQLIALAAIVDNPGLDATRLAELIDFDKATIGGVIERLERKGLVTREISPTDRRVKRLYPSETGAALLKRSIAMVQRVQDRLLQPLDKEERALFMDMLHRVIER